ncbi:MAG: hypothetical protein JXR10_04840 [Cyclobacteriaceae bacterium]
MRKASLLIAMFCMISLAHGQKVSIADVSPSRVDIMAFSLSADQTVNIVGSGGVFRDEYQLLIYYGWILDSDTREVVWHLFDEAKDRDFKRTDGVFDFSLDAPLKAGNYELYFTGAYNSRNWNTNWSVNSIEDLVDDIFDSRNKEKFRRSLQEELFITVKHPDIKEESIDRLLEAKLKKAKMYFVKAEDNERYEEGFNLSETTDFRIYSMGEGMKRNIYDLVWIDDLNNMERVYEMDYRNTSFAGGAEKNLKLDESITLPKGSYRLNYRTDDSHSFRKWNALPPDDPLFWGVAIFPETDADRRNFIAFDPPKTVSPLIQLTRIRNSSLESTGFTVTKDMEVKIVCLGEGDDDEEEMDDYGWIVDANTRRTVWKMKGYRSKSAGGASKNRKFEGTIELEKGDYIAYYSTDGSHAYGSWNANPPFDEELWGLTIYATDEGELDQIKRFDPDEFMSKNTLAEIVMVGDDAYEKKIFSLEKTTRVTIMAIGEGSDGEMYDTGWIKNLENGRIIWKMDYYDTENAGGARKNRMVIEDLELEPGDYRVYFETDGSHSFNDWNASPPNDPQSYGIRILIAE